MQATSVEIWTLAAILHDDNRYTKYVSWMI